MRDSAQEEGGNWQIQADTFTALVEDATLIVNHLSWLHINYFPTNLNFKFTTVYVLNYTSLFLVLSLSMNIQMYIYNSF